MGSQGLCSVTADRNKNNHKSGCKTVTYPAHFDFTSFLPRVLSAPFRCFWLRYYFQPKENT